MIINRFLHIKRYRQIIMVFIKYEFGTLIDQIGIAKYLKINIKFIKNPFSYSKTYTIGQRLRLSLEELGPTFIKLGQLISTRSDILPNEIISELEKLQDSVEPFEFSEIKASIERELDDKIEKIYKYFDEKPLAAASIAQIHRATLNSGKEVVVKVQRPRIMKIIELDLLLLKDLAYFFDHHSIYAKMYNFNEMVNEFEIILKNELDFTKEAYNCDIFRTNFSKGSGIFVPQISWIHTTKCVLTMEYIEGFRIDNFNELENNEIDRSVLAKKFASSIINQVLRDGFYHGDLHPGNIFIKKDGSIVFLDFGIIGRLSGERKNQFSNLFLGVAFKNSRLVVQSIIYLDTMSKKVNIKNIEKDIDRLMDKYLSMPLNELKIGELFRQIFKLAFSYNIMLPNEVTMLAKAFITTEWIIEKLDPNLNILVIAQPLARKLLRNSFSVDKVGTKLWNGLMDYNLLLKELPSFIFNLIRKIEDDDFTVHFELSGIANLQNWLDRIFNRISLSLIILASSIIIAAIIIGAGVSAQTGLDAYVLNITVLRIGVIIAGVMTAGLIYSIFRSGKL